MFGSTYNTDCFQISWLAIFSFAKCSFYSLNDQAFVFRKPTETVPQGCTKWATFTLLSHTCKNKAQIICDKPIILPQCDECIEICSNPCALTCWKRSFNIINVNYRTKPSGIPGRFRRGFSYCSAWAKAQLRRAWLHAHEAEGRCEQLKGSGKTDRLMWIDRYATGWDLLEVGLSLCKDKVRETKRMAGWRCFIMIELVSEMVFKRSPHPSIMSTLHTF